MIEHLIKFSFVCTAAYFAITEPLSTAISTVAFMPVFFMIKAFWGSKTNG